VIVDSTVAPKAVAMPIDSRLLETARAKFVEAAKAQGIASIARPKHVRLSSDVVAHWHRSPSWRAESIKQGRLRR
jgi:hypothetical protein